MDYGTTQENAAKILARFGRDAVITSAEGKRARSSAVFTNQTRKDELGVNSSTMAQTALDEKVVLVTGKLSFVPQVGDTVTAGTSSFRVTNVETVQPGATVLLYKLTVV